MSTPPPIIQAPDAGSPSARPVVASYLATFLKREMLHIYRQVVALRSFRPVVLAQKRENANEFPFRDVVILRKPRTHQLRRLWQKQILRRPITIYRSEATRLLATLRRIEARLLHVYFGHMGVYLLPLVERCDLPVVVSFHGADAQVDLDKPAYLASTRRLLERATLLLVRSESLRARLLAISADPAKIRLHRTGVPLEELCFRQRSSAPNGSWHAVQACRLIAKKGLPTTLRAFAQFARDHPRAMLTIAGEGPLLPTLQSLARSLEIAERVRFAGFLPQTELRALYADAHLFLHPSEMGLDGDQEGIPNSMLEAMATGLPVVATTHGGIPEAVEDGVSGLLVAEREPSALVEAMRALTCHPARYSEMSAAAARRVRDQFDLEQQARQLEACYAEALALHSSPPARALP